VARIRLKIGVSVGTLSASVSLWLRGSDVMAMIAGQRTGMIAARPIQLNLPIVLLSVLLLSGSSAPSFAENDRYIERVVTREIQRMLPAGEPGGAAVAVRSEGRTLFFNYGLADFAAKRPITPDTLFNLASLRKVLEATLLAQAVGEGELSLDDRASKYVTELKQGGDISRVTLGQLATHSSGLLLPQDHPPWPQWGYTLPQFIRTLNAWRADFEVGKPTVYTHAGYILLQLVLERRYGMPIDVLIEQRITRPLRMTSTTLPRRDDSPRGRLSPALKARAVQGYGDDGSPIGEPGNQQGYYHWPGTGQMFSTPRDMATLLAAHLGELPIERSLQDAMTLAQRGVLAIGPTEQQALAWETTASGGPLIVEKYGGLNNASAYTAMISSRKVGVVILGNRGNLYPSAPGRRILLELAAP
jgi:beta-lactamase class C